MLMLKRRFDILPTDNRIFQTSTGHIGIGLDTIEILDLLYVLKGCNMSIILRCINSYYEVVGIVMSKCDGRRTEGNLGGEV
jgi:hypothetical protein